MNKRVLLICYYFPPLGLGGIGRPLNLLRKLPQYGIDCHILTVKPVAYRAYEPELLEGLDAGKIHRSGSADPQRLLYLAGVREVKSSTISAGRPVADKFFPDSKVGWVNKAVRLGEKLHLKYQFDALISTSPPISSHLVGRRLAEAANLPWIADFRDYWTMFKAEDAYRDDDRRKRARKLLDEIGDRASAVVGVNQAIADYLGTGEVIANGYDIDLAEQWHQPPSKDIFTLGLLGHLDDSKPPAGLMTLLSELKKRRPDLLSKLRLLQVGEIDKDWLKHLMADNHFDIELDLRGRLPRTEVIKVLAQAHLFYMQPDDQVDSGVLPAKVFELVASGRPIIASAEPESELARFLDPVDNAVCFTDSSIDKAVTLLFDRQAQFENDGFCFAPLSEYAQRFSSTELARRYAALLERVI